MATCDGLAGAPSAAPSPSPPAGCTNCDNEDNIWFAVRGRVVCGNCGVRRPATATPVRKPKFSSRVVVSTPSTFSPRAFGSELTNTTASSPGRSHFKTKAKVVARRMEAAAPEAAQPVGSARTQCTATRSVITVDGQRVLMSMRGSVSAGDQLCLELYYVAANTFDRFTFRKGQLGAVAKLPPKARMMVLAHLESPAPADGQFHATHNSAAAERLAPAEAARIKAEQEAAAEAARIKAEQEAAAEAARIKAGQEAAAEAARIKAEQEAAAEAARIKAEQEAAAEAARFKAEQEAAAEAARIKAEQEAAAEAARIKAEQDAAAEAARIKAEQEAAAEAARIKAEQEAAAEAARIKAEQEAAAEAARIKAEQEEAAEAARIKAEQEAAPKEPTFSQAELAAACDKAVTAAVANATATINERHKLETAMLVNQLELVQARADTDAVENAALKRKIEEYDAVLGEFEATCAEVEQSKVLALEEARAVRITLEERLDEARTKVGALAEELVNTRSRLEQVQEQYTTLQTSSREELARCKLDRDTALRAQEETGTKLAAANAEVARQKARVDRTLKVAQTKLGEAKTVHDKQHAQLVAMAGDLKASQAAFKDLQAKTVAIQRQGKRAKEAAAAAEAAVAKHKERSTALSSALTAKTEEASTLTKQVAELEQRCRGFETKVAEVEQAAAKAKASYEAEHGAKVTDLETQLRSYKLKLFDMREALERSNSSASGAAEIAELKTRLRQAIEQRDTAVAEKRELEQISAQLLEMVDKK